MSENKFKTMRHIETVRNYLNACASELLTRGEYHDQTKLQSPEVEVFEEYTPKLKDVEYGSEEYKSHMRGMKPALDHHFAANDHHPEFHPNGIQDMNLIQLLEMLCDWKAAGMRSPGGDIFKSLDINAKRFGYSDELYSILHATARWIESQNIYHKADES